MTDTLHDWPPPPPPPPISPSIRRQPLPPPLPSPPSYNFLYGAWFCRISSVRRSYHSRSTPTDHPCAVPPFSSLPDRFYIADCARMRFYMSDYNFSAIARFQTHTKAVYFQRWHGWCHMEPLPSRAFCVHHTTAMHHVTSGKATYVRCVRI